MTTAVEACAHEPVTFTTYQPSGRPVEVTECPLCGEVLAVEPIDPHGTSQRAVRSRLAHASVQLIGLRSELEQLTADLSWLQVLAAGAPDLEHDR